MSKNPDETKSHPRFPFRHPIQGTEEGTWYFTAEDARSICNDLNDREVNNLSDIDAFRFLTKTYGIIHENIGIDFDFDLPLKDLQTSLITWLDGFKDAFMIWDKRSHSHTRDYEERSSAVCPLDQSYPALINQIKGQIKNQIKGQIKQETKM